VVVVVVVVVVVGRVDCFPSKISAIHSNLARRSSMEALFESLKSSFFSG